MLIPIIDGDKQSEYLTRIKRLDLLELADSLPASDLGKPLFGKALKPEQMVRAILQKVKAEGDHGLREIAKVLDNFKGDSLSICPNPNAYKKVAPEFLMALRLSIQRVKDFHQRQFPQSFFLEEEGITLGWRLSAVKRAGLYVPGGTAPLVSSLVMTAIPALIAGVKEICVATPVKNGFLAPEIEVAALELGIGEILPLGGAQAIAAFAYGTETVKKVDVIAGPGNLFVTLAKKEVYGLVNIDMLAGPSEILIIADSNAKAELLAADLLSQAEHDRDAAAILIVTDRNLANEVNEELNKQLTDLPRKDYALASLKNHGVIIVVNDLQHAAQIANEIAPEHLEVQVSEPETLLPYLENAGAIFLGEYASEPLGDYILGPNHVLPTSGTARFASPLSVSTFLKATSVLKVNKIGYNRIASAGATLAAAEGLDAHQEAILRREKYAKS